VRLLYMSFGIKGLSLVLHGGRLSMPHPSCSTPRKETRYSPYIRLGGLQGLSGWVKKMLHQPGFNSKKVQIIELLY